jgi:NAD(P)-dependent dehydrogenase (short-subunit alcohol dehydrogenase family)
VAFALVYDLTGRVALVTGGNSGIGLAIGRTLADAGASIAVWGRERRDADRRLLLADRRAALFLADPSLTFHTGDTVVVDGGYSIF